MDVWEGKLRYRPQLLLYTAMRLWAKSSRRRVFGILPDTLHNGPKCSEDLHVCGGPGPFLRCYWVAGGDSTIAPGEFLKSQKDKRKLFGSYVYTDKNDEKTRSIRV